MAEVGYYLVTDDLMSTVDADTFDAINNLAIDHLSRAHKCDNIIEVRLKHEHDLKTSRVSFSVASNAMITPVQMMIVQTKGQDVSVLSAIDAPEPEPVPGLDNMT